MKIVFNKTQKAYTKIDDALQFYVGTGQKELYKTFAVVMELSERGKILLAFFTDEEKAKECLESIIDYWIIGKTHVLEIENDVKESILVVPESIQNKSN
jgi:hypothetical protein